MLATSPINNAEQGSHPMNADASNAVNEPVEFTG